MSVAGWIGLGDSASTESAASLRTGSSSLSGAPFARSTVLSSNTISNSAGTPLRSVVRST